MWAENDYEEVGKMKKVFSSGAIAAGLMHPSGRAAKTVL